MTWTFFRNRVTGCVTFQFRFLFCQSLFSVHVVSVHYVCNVCWFSCWFARCTLMDIGHKEIRLSSGVSSFGDFRTWPFFFLMNTASGFYDYITCSFLNILFFRSVCSFCSRPFWSTYFRSGHQRVNDCLELGWIVVIFYV